MLVFRSSVLGMVSMYANSSEQMASKNSFSLRIDFSMDMLFAVRSSGERRVKSSASETYALSSKLNSFEFSE